MATISQCQSCLMRVMAAPDGTCPSCGTHIVGVSDELIEAPLESHPTPNLDTVASDQPPIVEFETIALLAVSTNQTVELKFTYDFASANKVERQFYLWNDPQPNPR